MNAAVLKRFIVYMALLTFVMFTVWALVRSFMNRPPGDYETEVCDMRLKDKLYDQAIQAANIALEGSNYVWPLLFGLNTLLSPSLDSQNSGSTSLLSLSVLHFYYSIVLKCILHFYQKPRVCKETLLFQSRVNC